MAQLLCTPIRIWRPNFEIGAYTYYAPDLELRTYFADERIANLDETTAHWLKLSAKQDGSFTVTNGRTGATMSYAAHR